MEIKKIALLGLGAIGSVFAKALYEKYEENFAVVANGERKQRIEKNGVKVNGVTIFPTVISSDSSDWKPDLLLVTVKNYQLESALEDIKNFVDKNTILLPLLNGITAQERTTKVFPQNDILHGLVFIDAMRNGNEILSGSNGKIFFGTVNNIVEEQKIQSVKKVFDEAEIENEICEDMLRILWRKWMINIGGNQISAIVRNTYGEFIEFEELHKLLQSAMMEVVKVAQAMHVNLKEQDIIDYDENLKTFIADGKTSMLQDIEAGRKTEVDYFSGTLIEIARKVKIEVPINQTFYYLIKGIEKKNHIC